MERLVSTYTKALKYSHPLRTNIATEGCDNFRT